MGIPAIVKVQQSINPKQKQRIPEKSSTGNNFGMRVVDDISLDAHAITAYALSSCT
jgi:hypothetical protein